MQENDIEDPVEVMLKKTGCIELHYKVQNCIAETNDWRQCQNQVKDFRKCMERYTKEQREKYDKKNSEGIKIVPPLYKNTKMALVVRNDIRMTKGKIAAQCSHAAVLCYELAKKHNSNLLKSWCKNGQPKIVLKVDSLNELETLHRLAKKNDLITAMVKDAGRTQLSIGTMTVIGIGPDSNEKIDEIVKHLKLL